MLTAAGAARPVRPRRGELSFFNPLPGPQGAWLSAASREGFSAQRHHPFPPPQSPSRAPGVWETSRLPGPARQGQRLAPRLKYPQKPSRTPSLPACPLCGWVRRLVGGGGMRCGTSRWLQRCQGEAALLWARLGSSLLLHTTPGKAARLVFSGDPRLCWAAAPRPCSGRALSALRLSLSRCIPDLAWSSLSGDFPGRASPGYSPGRQPQVQSQAVAARSRSHILSSGQ